MSRAHEIEPRVENALRVAFANLEAYLRAQLKTLNKEGGLLASDAFNIERLDRTIRTLRVEMEGRGFRTATMQLLEGLEEVHADVLAQAKKLGLPPEFSTESQAAIRMLLTGAEADLTQIAGAAEQEVGNLLRRATAGGLDFGDLIADIQTKLQAKLHQALTLATTALMSFNSQLRVQHAREAGVKWFAYAGPMDSVTRDWCGHWVGRRGTLEMFKATSGKWGRLGQPSPVSVWRGGWNCRHELVPLIGKAKDKYKVGPK